MRKLSSVISVAMSVYLLPQVELKFPAPHKGLYQYQLCIRSDSYLDVDYIKTIKVSLIFIQPCRVGGVLLNFVASCLSVLLSVYLSGQPSVCMDV